MHGDWVPECIVSSLGLSARASASADAAKARAGPARRLPLLLHSGKTLDRGPPPAHANAVIAVYPSLPRHNYRPILKVALANSIGDECGRLMRTGGWHMRLRTISRILSLAEGKTQIERALEDSPPKTQTNLRESGDKTVNTERPLITLC